MDFIIAGYYGVNAVILSFQVDLVLNQFLFYSRKKIMMFLKN